MGLFDSLQEAKPPILIQKADNGYIIQYIRFTQTVTPHRETVPPAEKEWSPDGESPRHDLEHLVQTGMREVFGDAISMKREQVTLVCRTFEELTAALKEAVQ